MFVHNVLIKYKNEWITRDDIGYGELDSDNYKSLHAYEDKDIEPMLAPYNVDYVLSSSKFDGGMSRIYMYTSGPSSEGNIHLYGLPSDASGSITLDLHGLPKYDWYQKAVMGKLPKTIWNPQTLVKGKKQMMVALIGSYHYDNGEYVAYPGTNEPSYAGNHFVLDIPDVLAISSAKSSNVKDGEFFSIPVEILSDRDVVVYMIEKASSTFPDDWEEVVRGALDEKEKAKVDGRWEIGFNGEWSDLYSDGKTLYRIKLVSVNDENKTTVHYNDLAAITKMIHLEAEAKNSGTVRWVAGSRGFDKSNIDIEAGTNLVLTAYAPSGKKFSHWSNEKGEVVSNSVVLKGRTDYFEDKGKLTANFIDKDASNSTLDVYVKSFKRDLVTTEYTKSTSPMTMNYHQGEDQITLHIDASSKNTYTQRVYYQVQIDGGDWDDERTTSMALSSTNDYADSHDMDIVKQVLSAAEGANVKVRFVLRDNTSKEVIYSNEISFDVMHKVTINCVGLSTTDRCRDLKAWYTENGRYVDDENIVEDVSVLERWYPHGATVTAAATPNSVAVLNRWEVCSDGSRICNGRDGVFTVVTKDSTVEAVVSQELIYNVYFDNRKLTTIVYPLNGLDAGAALQLNAVGEQPLESFSIEKATAFDNDKNPIAYEAVEDEIFFLEPGSYRLTINLGFQNDDDKKVAAYCNDYIGCQYTDNAIFNTNKGNMEDDSKTRMNRDYNHVYKGGETIAYYYNFNVEGVKITFYDGKTSVGTRYVPKNGKLLEGSYRIVKEGYELVGWCKDSACKEKWDYNTAISADVKLYAQWVEAEENSSSSAAQPGSSSSSVKSSSSKKTEAIVAAKSNYFAMSVSDRVVQIIDAHVGSAYAVLDMQGRVMTAGSVNAANITVVLPRAGSYMIRVGSQVQRVNVR